MHSHIVSCNVYLIPYPNAQQTKSPCQVKSTSHCWNNEKKLRSTYEMPSNKIVYRLFSKKIKKQIKIRNISAKRESIRKWLPFSISAALITHACMHLTPECLHTRFFDDQSSIIVHWSRTWAELGVSFTWSGINCDKASNIVAL